WQGSGKVRNKGKPRTAEQARAAPPIRPNAPPRTRREVRSQDG
ncbi:MAG: hypothetical protein AVDCRST_MAG08-979, partial [uncultured Acetobacteraceae bacterium]